MTKRSLDVGDQEGKVFEPPFEVAEKLETLPVSIMQLAIAVLASRCLNDTILIVLSFQNYNKVNYAANIEHVEAQILKQDLHLLCCTCQWMSALTLLKALTLFR